MELPTASLGGPSSSGAKRATLAPWTEKHRPKRVSAIVNQPEVSATCAAALRDRNMSHLVRRRRCTPFERRRRFLIWLQASDV